MTQLDIYTEEKFEDEEDMRERRLANHHESSAVSEPIVENLLHAAKQNEDIYPTVIEALGHMFTIMDTEIDTYVSYFVY